MGYYKYFANGDSEAGLGGLRWVHYDDFSTSTSLTAGCMPIYDKDKLDVGTVSLLGVVCMDVNVIVSLEELSLRDRYARFIEKADQMSKACRPVEWIESKLQKLRGDFECQACDMSREPCGVEQWVRG